MFDLSGTAKLWRLPRYFKDSSSTCGLRFPFLSSSGSWHNSKYELEIVTNFMGASPDIKKASVTFVVMLTSYEWMIFYAMRPVILGSKTYEWKILYPSSSEKKSPSSPLVYSIIAKMSTELCYIMAFSVSILFLNIFSTLENHVS